MHRSKQVTRKGSKHRLCIRIFLISIVCFLLLSVFQALSSTFGPGNEFTSGLSRPSPLPISRHKDSLVYMGNKKYNTGWYVDTLCLQKNSKKQSLIAYGFGAGMDISWDTGMVDQFGVSQYIFDPTEKSINYVKPIVAKYPGKIKFTPEGLSNKKGEIKFALPANPAHVSMRSADIADKNMERTVTAKVNTLSNFMRKLNHKYLDVLKIDIEGAEYDVLESLLEEDFMPFTQLLVEYHVRFLHGPEKERHARVLKGLKEKGFVEIWSQNGGQEVGYLKVADLPYCSDGISPRYAQVQATR